MGMSDDNGRVYRIVWDFVPIFVFVLGAPLSSDVSVLLLDKPNEQVGPEPHPKNYCDNIKRLLVFLLTTISVDFFSVCCGKRSLD